MNKIKFHIAEINIARMRGVNIDDPIMKEFADNLDNINILADSSPGFVWRMKDDTNNATAFNPYNDEQIIVNVSVWSDIKTLEAYTYKTVHTDFLKRRKEWFQHFGKAYYALWWVPVGHKPTLQECAERLELLQKNGPGKDAFNFKTRFPAPESE